MELSPEEVRVLGCLLEKERTRPDDYPLTLNALVAACNQTTNRDPVVHYDELTVERALTGLREKDLARRGVYSGSRVPKHRHSADETLGLDPPARAVLAVLALRGPQTVGELKARTERLHPFASPGDVDEVIDRLAAEPAPLVVRLARQPGQKEGRVAHLIGGPIAEGVTVAARVADHDRVGELEERVARLQGDLDALREEFDRYRSRS